MVIGKVNDLLMLQPAAAVESRQWWAQAPAPKKHWAASPAPVAPTRSPAGAEADRPAAMAFRSVRPADSPWRESVPPTDGS